MRFQTMWNVQPTKPQIGLRILSTEYTEYNNDSTVQGVVV